MSETIQMTLLAVDLILEKFMSLFMIENHVKLYYFQ